MLALQGDRLDLADKDFIVCQYKVAFDGDAVAETFWRRYQCRDAAAQAPRGAQ